jgi:hypothetical protein
MMVNMCYTAAMKAYIHARLDENDRVVLQQLKRATGRTESELIRRGLRLVAEAEGRQRSALDVAGRSVGRFRKGPRDLSTNRKHLRGFGE